MKFKCLLVVQYFFCRFPVSKQLKQQWLIAIERPDWIPSSVSSICSVHFSVNDLIINETSINLHGLKANAVPVLSLNGKLPTDRPAEVIAVNRINVECNFSIV